MVNDRFLGFSPKFLAGVYHRPKRPAATIAVGGSDWVQLALPQLSMAVITSYSIHYTKLYEAIGFSLFGILAVVSLSHAVASELGTLTPLLIAAGFFQAWIVPNAIRITSYNVCYTKLLRQGGDDQVERGGPYQCGDEV